MIGRALAVGKRAILSLPCGLGVLALPLLVEVRVEGPRPPGPCVLAVTHSGGPDPLYVARAVGSWRTPALFSIDPRYPFLRPFYRALWRFEIREGEKEFNRRTLRAAVEHLQKGGQIMVFADGPDFRRGTLKPGAAVLARRAGVPVVPIGLENAHILPPQGEELALGPLFFHVVRSLRRKGWICVHFGAAVFPDPSLPERADVDRMMRLLERSFDRYHRRFVGLPGPVWPSTQREGG
ncbi:MAG: lysophospholipid acyltransferase family protein [Candidatus Bipolaricaulis anaerobius]|nr:lysophospholipid acyltransferase family protein [Candidatus Bipolaricaulis anaerobius]